MEELKKIIEQQNERIAKLTEINEELFWMVITLNKEIRAMEEMDKCKRLEKI